MLWAYVAYLNSYSEFGMELGAELGMELGAELGTELGTELGIRNLEFGTWSGTPV